ncbi:hypothetical protein MMC07_001947 [Pseudocyphellaria aurata]|nr:hypothetical protein [Pseudocyphellaria aurata]
MAYSFLCTMLNVFLLLPVALAVPWIGATPTPEAGLMAMDGMSPRPTEAPGAGNVPRELLKRDSSYLFPPPDGCSNTASPYCGSYVFKGATLHNFYFCYSASLTPIPVEILNDFYATAIGSTLGIGGAMTGAMTGAMSGTRLTNPSTQVTSSPSITTPTTSTSITSQHTTAAADSHKGLAVGAIAGIAVGAGCSVLAVVAGMIIWFCIRKRRRSHTTVIPTQPQPHATFDPNPPMQQTFPDQAYLNTAQNSQYPPSKPAVLNEPPQYPASPQNSIYASTYNGHPSPTNSPLLAHDPTNRMSNISPPEHSYNHSTTTPTSAISQKPPFVGDGGYPQPPNSSAATDAGGMAATMGNSTPNEHHHSHEVSGVPMRVQDQDQFQKQDQSLGAVHEVSAQSEPRYTAYSPNQHESSYTTYTQNFVQDHSGTQSYHNTQTSSQEPLSGHQSSPRPWEISELRGSH